MMRCLKNAVGAKSRLALGFTIRRFQCRYPSGRNQPVTQAHGLTKMTKSMKANRSQRQKMASSIVAGRVIAVSISLSRRQGRRRTPNHGGRLNGTDGAMRYWAAD